MGGGDRKKLLVKISNNMGKEKQTDKKGSVLFWLLQTVVRKFWGRVFQLLLLSQLKRFWSRDETSMNLRINVPKNLQMNPLTKKTSKLQTKICGSLSTPNRQLQNITEAKSQTTVHARDNCAVCHKASLYLLKPSQLSSVWTRSVIWPLATLPCPVLPCCCHHYQP